MAKQVLRSLDLVALAVALDRAEEAGLNLVAPTPRETPAECVYLKYIGPEQLGLIASRLPHAIIQLRTMDGAGKNKKLVHIFRRDAIEHVLGFLLQAEDLPHCTRSMDTIHKKYWKVIAAAADGQ